MSFNEISKFIILLYFVLICIMLVKYDYYIMSITCDLQDDIHCKNQYTLSYKCYIITAFYFTHLLSSVLKLMKDFPMLNMFNIHENLIEALLAQQAYADVQAVLSKYDGMCVVLNLDACVYSLEIELYLVFFNK